jgi:hypothetical protein
MSLAEASAHPAAARAAAGSSGRSSRARFSYQALVDVIAWIFVASGAISLLEPSPYDFLSVVVIPLWWLAGFKIHRSFVPLYFLLVLNTTVGFLALAPVWDDPNAALFEYQSAYLTVTGLFFALFAAQRTERRIEVILSSYTFGAVIAAACGILGYFKLFGLQDVFSLYGRASGTFKDPNVLGSFLILGVLYLLQNLMLGRARGLLSHIGGLALLVAGVFLSFSRGSWGATIFATVLMMTSAYFTAKGARIKRRIVIFALVAIVVAAVTITGLLSIDATREFFLQRAAIAQDYDSGETGRFGNQLRSLPIILERFWGFGPLQYRLTFGIDTHDSYLGAFANNGWLGGFVYLLLVGLTCWLGFGLMYRTSPFQRRAQVVFPTLLGFFLQAFQIDIDHWRHVTLMMGVVWGLEAARQKWLARQVREHGEFEGAAAAGPVNA